MKTVEKVFLPDGLQSIEAGCFWHCERLAEVHVPASCTEIEEYAFLDCTHLTIFAPEGSEAEQYAKENGIRFVVE